MEHYLKMLEDGLRQKKHILKELRNKTAAQSGMIKADNADWDAFDRLVDEKAVLIEQLSGLDDGFESVFERVREKLDANREQYKEQIHILQTLIKEVTELSTSLMADEARNKELVTKRFLEEKDKIRQGRVSSKAATNYYKSMSRVNYIDPQLMDRKK